MKESKITRTSTRPSHVFHTASAVPVILVAYAPRVATTVDRCLVSASFTVGRGSRCDFSIVDDKISKRHFRILREAEGFFVEDLGSSNGTFLFGVRLSGREALPSPALIRAGRAVLVFHANGGALLEPASGERFGMAGHFHTGPLIQALREAALSSRHVLLAGPSGTGKELSARALASMMGRKGSPLSLLAHNAARFSSEEEAAATLFGVASRVFSSVDARPGLIEQASGGVLFLDEIHNLPERVQRTLLRVIEDGELARIGESRARSVDVRFVFASNAPGSTYSLASDLLARLRVVRVPPLIERMADVPAIFDAVLARALAYQAISDERVFQLLRADHYESLCLDGFDETNVRGLVDLADRLVTRVKAGAEPAMAAMSIFSEQFADGLVIQRYQMDSQASASTSYYEQNKDIIIAAFRECGGNISATTRLLDSRGVSTNRRWLTVFIDRWGLRRT